MLIKIANITLFFLIILSSLYPTNSFSQSTDIQSIIVNPKNYNGQNVELIGLVSQYVKENNRTNYLLKGEYGGIIRILPSDIIPKTNEKYKIQGIVEINPKTSEVFLIETSQKILNQNQITETEKNDDIGNILIIAILILGSFLAVLLFYALRKLII